MDMTRDSTTAPVMLPDPMHECRGVDNTRPFRARSCDMAPRTLHFTLKSNPVYGPLSGRGAHDDRGHGNDTGTT
ncbi:hypothetical protein WI26_26175 [Burkholderia diffusa]|nr:hypothetical protein WI26_26175 [Burkholderia diffusa]